MPAKTPKELLGATEKPVQPDLSLPVGRYRAPYKSPCTANVGASRPLLDGEVPFDPDPPTVKTGNEKLTRDDFFDDTWCDYCHQDAFTAECACLCTMRLRDNRSC